MDVQQIELTLMRKDLRDIMLAFQALQDNKSIGYIGLALSPIIGFTIDESYKYFISRGLINDLSNLFTKYKISVKKSRALLKLFDDSDGGMEGLIDLLYLFQVKSSEWMNAGKTPLKRFVGEAWLQPDIGLYFFGEDPIYMSIVGFSTYGKTKQEIAALTDADYMHISEEAYAYGIALGEYFGAMDAVMSYFQVPIDSKKKQTISETFWISHNDFRSNKLNRRVKLVTRTDQRIALALLFILTQVNLVNHVLPQILPADSYLLERIQFMTAYHATRSLSEIELESNSGLANLSFDKTLLSNVPNIRKVRNTMAHYGLGEGSTYTNGKGDILDDVIKGYCGYSKLEILDMSKALLDAISGWTQSNLSKHQLKNIRAILGDHT